MYRIKRELLSSVLLRFGDDRRAQIGVFQQIEPDRTYLINVPAFAASFRKRDSFDGAIASDARDPTKQSVACDLARHVAAFELQQDLMPRHIGQITRRSFPFLDQPEFSFRKIEFG